MAEQAAPKPVTATEPILLFVGSALLVGIIVHAVITGWFWIPGSSRGGGAGHWASRTDDLAGYLIYLAIIGAAALGVFAMARARLRRYEAQRPVRRK